MSMDGWWKFEGRTGRSEYFFTGFGLVIFKYIVDASVAAHFHQRWPVWNYLIPPPVPLVAGSDNSYARLYWILWALAIPFFWVGVALTLRRLRDAGKRLGWIFLFFVPFANVLLFLCLSALPSTDQEFLSRGPRPGSKAFLHGPVPAMLIAGLLGLVFVLFGANVLAEYAWSLFLGVPFATGFVASWILNSERIHSPRQTIIISILTPFVIGLLTFGLKLEGIICLAMAPPLSMPFSIAGGLAARCCLQTRIGLPTSGLTACVALLPLLMTGEYIAAPQPPVRPVTTSVTVNAPVDAVWRSVISFPPLPSPHEWIFRAGIAYPIGATITGSGQGAIRRCRFSTGDFVEPITVWDQDHLLAFNVESQPPALREIGFGLISTPHVNLDYMRSSHGQFRLVALDATHTLLVGTTWYQDYFWPQLYWRPLSDSIVHRIHARVLEHVKIQAESSTVASTQ